MYPGVQIETRTPRWSAPTRVAFRFGFLYFGLYILVTQMFPEMLLGADADDAMMPFPDLGAIWPARQIVTWTAVHLFHVTAPLVIDANTSGDKIFDWTQAFCLLVVAVAGTVIWSVFDRRRQHYEKIATWFHLFVRLALGSTLVIYGVSKMIPTQMPLLLLTKLVEPYGHFSPMGVLWASMSAAPAYESLTGCVETLAGLLLLFPRTATLGALVALPAMVQVFVLNMTYDVPVKLFSFHLILLTLVVLAPQARRLTNAVVLNRTVAPPTAPTLFSSVRANRIALVVQWVFAAYTLAVNVSEYHEHWRSYGSGKTKSPLYGIWDVTSMTVDGVARPPLLTDNDRWRRVIFDSNGAGNFVAVQHVDDTVTRYPAQIDTAARTITLTARNDGKWPDRVNFDRPHSTQLRLEGHLDGHPLGLGLTLVDQNQFLLLTRGFHWVQEYPLNR